MRADVLLPPPRRAPDLDDDFAGPDLRTSWWIDHYLPQWTTPDRSRARYDLGPRGLRLRIDADQPDWRPEDGPSRVSNLQTAAFAGPTGGSRGTHRHRPDGLVVRTPVPTQLLWTPTAGRLDVTVSASRDPGCMIAAWLVGTEHRDPAESGEVCVFEIDADAVAGASTTARCGIKAHHDPRLTTDMADVVVPVDASRSHTWTVVWGGGRTVIGCEGVLVRQLAQSPDYPMQLMLDLFEVGGDRSGAYPRSAWVHRVRGWDESTPRR